MNATSGLNLSIVLASACFGLLEVIPLARSAVLTFDDLSPGTSNVVVPNGYGGSLWTNFEVLDASRRPANDGYRKGMVSSPNVAFNGFGAPASFSSNGVFDLNSAYVTAAFVNGLQVRVRGLIGTNLLYDHIYVVGTNAPTFIDFDYLQIDNAQFSTTPGSWFVLDDLTISSTNLIVNFVANTNFGRVPLTVQFTDQSTGSITNWDWNFGDGSAHSFAQSPSHTYNSDGTFSVTFTVTDRLGLSSNKFAMITVISNTPVANFAASPTSGREPLTVQFTDQSSGIITNWDWNFDDGSLHSPAQNPSHTYNTNGNFIVTLTVAGSNGFSSSHSATISVASCAVLASPPLSPGMVRGWGCNYYGQINTACIGDVVAIAAGRDFSLFLKKDGTVVALGAYYDGGPVVVPAGLSNVIAVAGGDSHSLALKSDGTVVAWGTTTVPPGLTNIVAISAGAFHSLALQADGTVLGFGTSVPAGLSNVVAISGGRQISLALKADGTVVGWNLLNGADSSSLSNIVAISAGDDCCYEAWEALSADGTVFLGSAFNNTWAPAPVNGAVAISASRGTDGHISWALRSDGTVVAMPLGFNFCGGPWLPSGLSNVVAVASGDAHNLALVGDGPPVLRTPLLNPAWDTNGFRVSARTQNGRVYRLEYKSSLADSDWIALPLVAGNGSLRTLSDPTATGSQRFYRVRRW